MARRKVTATLVAIWLLAAIGLAGVRLAGTPWADLWSTPDQRAAAAFASGDYEAAADEFADLAWRATARYRARDFERAAADFGRRDTAEMALGRGNAWVMQGKYDAAIESYDRALELRPEWQAARDNRELARLRRDRLQVDPEDRLGTGGMLGADDIVIDPAKPGENKAGDPVEVGAGQALSDEELRALWLRRVQTKPADFLRAKFAYQQQRRGAEAGDGR